MNNEELRDKLRFCPNCNSDSVFPHEWEPIDQCPEFPDHWIVTLYCGDCETYRRDIFTQVEVELYEEWLDDTLDEMQKLERKYMAAWVDSFSDMLKMDIILPEDF